MCILHKVYDLKVKPENAMDANEGNRIFNFNLQRNLCIEVYEEKKKEEGQERQRGCL